LKAFVGFPWRLYRGDPNWTPPLKAELLGNRLLGITGLLTKEHPYHQDAEVTHFMAWRGDEPVGTVSAAVNRAYNEYHGERIGSFGFFECVDDEEVSRALLDAARSWVAERGMTVMRGPGQYSNATHERQALLIEGFDTPPTVDLTHNPPYYQRLIESYGMTKAKDYVAYMLDVQAPLDPRVTRIAEAARIRSCIETRPVDMSRIAEEVRLIIDIYNDAWSENWGFLPVTPAEADLVAESLAPVIDPGLMRFAYVKGEPVAVLGSLPDPYWPLRPRWNALADSDLVRLGRLLATRRHIPRVRLMFFGIKAGFRREGIDAVLFAEMHPYAQAKGYQVCDISMLLEDNDLVLRASKLMGAHQYKRWRIYDMPIG
jgi:hypothetical protein